MKVSKALEDVVDEDGGELLQPYVDQETQMTWIGINVPLIDLYRTSLNSFVQALAFADALSISALPDDGEAGLHIKIGIKCQQLGDAECSEQ